MKEPLLTKAKRYQFAWFDDPSDLDMRRVIANWNPLKSSNQALELLTQNDLAIMTQGGMTGVCYGDSDEEIVFLEGTDLATIRKAIVTAYIYKHEPPETIEDEIPQPLLANG